MKDFRHTITATVLLAAGAIGCTDNQVKTYRVAKEAKPSAPLSVSHNDQDGHDHSAGDPHGHSTTIPHLHWQMPAGWEEQKPDRMRAASFLIRGEEGRLGQVAIIPLPGVSNIELESVNMWRKELSLPDATREAVDQGERVQVGDFSGRLYDMVAENPRTGDKFKNRILGVIGERKGIYWFIKMVGEDTLIAAQKPALVQFLKTLEFHEGSHDDASSAAPGGAVPVSTNTEKVPADSNLPQWKVPANWTEKAPGAMVSAAYAVNLDGGAAEVTISKLAGEGGGVVANVNRWRGQLGLKPGTDSEIKSSIEELDIEGRKGYLADLKGTNVRSSKPARMIAVGVPRDGETWFYKFMGDESVVAKEKDAFVQFIKSAY